MIGVVGEQAIVELVDEAALLSAAPFPHKHALLAVFALVIGNAHAHKRNRLPVTRNGRDGRSVLVTDCFNADHVKVDHDAQDGYDGLCEAAEPQAFGHFSHST